jgi:hypothetical protein
MRVFGLKNFPFFISFLFVIKNLVWSRIRIHKILGSESGFGDETLSTRLVLAFSGPLCFST